MVSHGRTQLPPSATATPQKRRASPPQPRKIPSTRSSPHAPPPSRLGLAAERVQPSDVEPRAGPPEAQARHRRRPEAESPERAHILAVVEVVRNRPRCASGDAQQAPDAAATERQQEQDRRAREVGRTQQQYSSTHNMEIGGEVHGCVLKVPAGHGLEAPNLPCILFLCLCLVWPISRARLYPHVKYSLLLHTALCTSPRRDPTGTHSSSTECEGQNGKDGDEKTRPITAKHSSARRAPPPPHLL